MENKDNKNKKPIHSGHRQRMREKALEYGFETVKEHEVLEMLLFLGIPQRNTNPLAHELINTFGSFSAVFEADYEDLVAVKGMTQTAAFSIKMMPEIFSRYIQDKSKEKLADVEGTKDAFNYFYPKYVGATNEILYLMLLDNAGKVLSLEKLSLGGPSSSEVEIRKIIERCVKYRATQAILCHNHPSGKLEPSNDDFITTSKVYRVLNSIGVTLVDHLIVYNDKFVSLRENENYSTIFAKPNN